MLFFFMEVPLSALKRFFAYKDTSFFSSDQMKLDTALRIAGLFYSSA
jgi:hypothetical protein